MTGRKTAYSLIYSELLNQKPHTLKAWGFEKVSFWYQPECAGRIPSGQDTRLFPEGLTGKKGNRILIIISLTHL
jgi:hypothetical protein